MKRHLLILVTAVVLLFGGSAIGSSVAHADFDPGGGGMQCHSGVAYVYGYVYNAAYGRYMWHQCAHISLWAVWHGASFGGPYWAGNYLGSGPWINGWMWQPL
jgi:hypothetical protein